MTNHSASQQTIPKIIHQTWKNNEIPSRWQQQVKSVKQYHPDWEYKLWTDADIDLYVKENHPDFYPVFAGYDKPIMRADAIRYVLMYDFGGMYCDLDFEFLRPYSYDGEQLLLSEEFSVDYGDAFDQVANYFFASVPGHPFWADVIKEMTNGEKQAHDYHNVVGISGPAMISRVFFANRAAYLGVNLTERPVFSPRRLHGGKERKIFLNSGITYGFHHGSGSWKERFSLVYWKVKLKSLFR